MAQSVHLFLKAAGNEVHGESTIKSLDRENSIECLSFTDAVRTAREASSGMATGDRTYEPLVVQKRIDKSSPLLAKALCNNEEIEGTFRFYRPSPTGDGGSQGSLGNFVPGERETQNRSPLGPGGPSETTSGVIFFLENLCFWFSRCFY